MRADRVSGLALLVATTIIWGSTFPLVRGAVAHVPPLQFVTWRFALAGACLLPWLFGQGVRAALPGLGVGLANAAGFLLQTFALKTASADQVAFLTGLSVVLVAIADAAGHGRRPPAQVLGALVVGVVGLALLTVGRGFVWSVGDLLGLIGAGMFTLQVLGTSRLARRVGSMRLAAQEVTSGAVAFIIASAVWQPSGLGPPPHGVWPLIAFMAVVATVGTLVLQSAGQARVGATTAAMTFNLEPVFASAWAFVLTGESLTLREGLGAVLVLASMVVAALAPGEAAAAAGAQGALVPAGVGEDPG